MAIQLDNMHWDSRSIDGYDKDINFIYGPREPGKTTYMWTAKIYRPWKKDKRPWIYLVRQSVEINEALIESILDNNINKFDDDNVKFKYAKGEFKDGIVDVSIGKEIFFRIVSLSIPTRRIKLAILRNAKGAYMDEYIIDKAKGEKYNTGEWNKIKEAYTTWRRECEGKFKMYFTANNYSEYNPIFAGIGVNGTHIKKGEILIGDYWAIEKCIIKPELKEYLLSKNPFYKFDDEYRAYGLEGEAVNDANINLGSLPINYTLQYIFKADGRYIGVFRNKYIDDLKDRYFCQFLSVIGAYRNVYCFDFEELIKGCALLSHEDRMKFSRFKRALQINSVAFSQVDVYYLVIEIYKFL